LDGRGDVGHLRLGEEVQCRIDLILQSFAIERDGSLGEGQLTAPEGEGAPLQVETSTDDWLVGGTANADFTAELGVQAAPFHQNLAWCIDRDVESDDERLLGRWR